MQTPQRTCGVLFSIQLEAKKTAIPKTGISYKDNKDAEAHETLVPNT
jgi:hypothetical protein